MIIEANFVNIYSREIYPAKITMADGHILSVERVDAVFSQYVLPGFVDAHVHIESSMLVPSEFARLAVRHGTVATVSDPHEIANVLGAAGVDYMIENGRQVPFHFFFGAPSCVPATNFETAGAVIDSREIETLLGREEILYLSEMMNFPGAIAGDAEVMAKIAAAQKHNKPVDGHAPGLSGDALKKYVSRGISTDHECFTLAEAQEKAMLGMHILIREGSAAKNFEALIPLLGERPGQVMFCSDDKHPDDLLLGHINKLVQRAVKAGYNLMDVLCAACINPVAHYKLPVGTLRVGDPADFIVVKDLKDFEVLATWIRGEPVYADGKTHIHPVNIKIVNHFNCSPKTAADFKTEVKGPTMRVIDAIDGQLITGMSTYHIPSGTNFFESDIKEDILKMVVVNRYADMPPAIAFIRNFGLKRGAIASCVAHDCHNIVAVGTSDHDLCAAVNQIIMSRGGISLADGIQQQVLPLPVAGIMSDREGEVVAEQYAQMDRNAKALGSKLRAPFMSLSFMALLVIPSLKLSDKGLFDGNEFKFVSLFG